jgi:predicted permease
MAFGCGIVIAAVVTLLFKSNPQQEVVLILNSILQAAGVLGILMVIYFRYKLWQSKQKSTYSFLFNRNGFIQIINLAAIASGLFQFKGYNTFTDYHFMSTLGPIIFLLVPFFYLNVAFQHLRFENKLKLSCH